MADSDGPPHDGQKSIYFDANDSSQFIDNRQSSNTLGGGVMGSTIEEESSPWASSEAQTPAGPSTNTILPPSAHGYLNYSMNTGSENPHPLSETETTTFRDDESVTLMGSVENSYMGHLRAQSTLPHKWLNDVDIDNYLAMPKNKNSGKYRKDSVFPGSGQRYLKEPLLEELLPTSRKESLFPAIHGPVGRKDKIVAAVYWTMLAIMFCMGVILFFIYPAELRDRLIRSTTLFRAIADSSWILTTSIFVGSLVSVTWILLLRWFTKEVVYMMVYFAPVTTLLVGLWALIEFFHADPGGGFWLFLTAIASFGTSALLTTFMLANRKSIQHTVDIVKVSSDILVSNSGIYFASLLLLAGYLVFVSLWIVFYLHSLMLGRVVEIPADVLSKMWQLNSLSYYIQAYFIFMLVWTSMIFSYLQKAMIGGVVARWYFFRTDPNDFHDSTPAMDSLKASITTLFGHVCLASLILSFVRLTRLFINLYKYAASKLETPILSSLLRSVSLFFGFVERLFEHVTDLAIYFGAMTGEGFWSSGRAVFKVFRRNMLVGFTTDMIARIIFNVSTMVAAACTGLSSYMFVSHTLKSEYGLSAAVLFSLLTWYVLCFFTSIFSDTYLFSCYK